MSTAAETILADAALKAIESETTENYRQEIKRKGMLIEAEKDSGKLLDLGKMALEAHLHRVLIKALPIGLAKASTLDVRSLMISLEICLISYRSFSTLLFQGWPQMTIPRGYIHLLEKWRQTRTRDAAISGCMAVWLSLLRPSTKLR